MKIESIPIKVLPRSENADITIVTAMEEIWLDTADATRLRDDLTAALLANAEADRPKLAVTPGRYRMGFENRPSIGVVTAIADGHAYGYHECGGRASGALSWGLDGRHSPSPSCLDLVARLPDPASTETLGEQLGEMA